MRVSNRVFWAAVFLAGCGMLSSGVKGREQTKGVFDSIKSTQIETSQISLVDKDGKTKMLLSFHDNGTPNIEWGMTNASKGVGGRIGVNRNSAFVALRDENDSNVVVDRLEFFKLKESKFLESQPPRPTGERWTEITRFTGSNSRNTEPFTIKSERWRARWTLTSDEKTVIFGASVESISGKIYVGSLGVVTKPGSDTTNFYKPGTFYLDINVSSDSQYEIIIEELGG